MDAVQVRYYTDPVCPWSWAFEPSLRRLIARFGDGIQISYVMGGLVRESPEPLARIRAMLEASAAGAMPSDPRLWLEAAPASSYPACIAVKAAAEQGDPGRYLRRLREGLLCRRRKLDTSEALVEEARASGALNIERFRIDLSSHAILEAFGADLELAAAAPAEHHGAAGRVRLPSVEFLGRDGEPHGVYGFADYGSLEAAARRAGAGPASDAPPSIEEALRGFGTMATAEVAAVCELPGPRAPAELWRLATEWRIKPERIGGGELWTLA